MDSSTDLLVRPYPEVVPLAFFQLADLLRYSGLLCRRCFDVFLELLVRAVLDLYLVDLILTLLAELLPLDSRRFLAGYGL